MKGPTQNLLKQPVFYLGLQGDPYIFNSEVHWPEDGRAEIWHEPGSREPSCATECDAHPGTGQMRKAFTTEVYV